MESVLHSSSCDYDNSNEKMCRFCGCESIENVHIFAANKTDNYHLENMDQEDLLHKISTVYPVLLYENDPLPQHICPECIDMACSLYRDIQQVLMHQKNLVNMIKAQKPDHDYFRILNSIEKSIETTKETIKTTFDVEIYPNIPQRLLTISRETTHFSKNTPNANELLNDTQKPESDSLVKNIQTKLELNGFTIKRIKVAAAQNETSSTENLAADESYEEEVKESCQYCEMWFPTKEALALHQVIHLKLSSEKIFEKRLLPKHLRRGRLITVNDQKNIRCLNCWQIFKDNKAILRHWSGSDCHYYCFICSQEYPQSPKLLREHVLNVHGISYRSAAKQFILSHSEPPALTEEIKETPNTDKPSGWKIPLLFAQTMGSQSIALKKPSKKKRFYYTSIKSSTKHADGTFSCNVCHKVFNNYRSSNSHMRVHYVTDICASANKDVYTQNDDQFKPLDPPAASATTSSTINKFQSPILKPLTAAATTTRPAYKIITNNGPLRGIKTKIVQKRNEFLANNSVSQTVAEQNRLYSDWLTATTSDSDQFNLDESSKSSSHSNNYSEVNDYVTTPPLSVIKKEPTETSDDVAENKQWNCFICKEFFGSSKEYEMHAMFVHNIN